MKRKLEYEIVSDATLQGLVYKVNYNLQLGWELVGGVAFSNGCYQAMARDENYVEE